MNIRQVSRKLVPIAFLSLAASSIATPARANHLDFTLYNDSSYPIQAIYIKAARSNNWGPDILGRDTLGMGDSTRITFPGQSPSSPCVYDIDALLADNSHSSGRFNLCKVDVVNVR